MKLKSLHLFFVLLIVAICNHHSNAQGLNHNFLIGYTGIDVYTSSKRGVLAFDSNAVNVIPNSFKMPFASAQANISDEDGKLLFYTNGCWIADATGDTMQNGSGLYLGTDGSWCSNISGMPYLHSVMIIPWPGDSSKYILFHQAAHSSLNNMCLNLYYTVVDITLNGGLGAVTQKNLIAIQDTINPGISACKHANGRDWWITAFKDKTDIVYKLLLTPSGIINVSQQHLNMPPHTNYDGQTLFSPDGNKFAYHLRGGVINAVDHEIRLFDFDRCTGMMSNGNKMNFIDSSSGMGLSFSPNSKYLYFSTFRYIFQLNTDTNNVVASKQTVAQWDGYCYPFNFTCSVFWPMYLAANGKIYITSGSNLIDINYINSTDSSGAACDVRQHALRVPCYTYRGNVNHPNYYLGPLLGSVCDSLSHVGLQEHLNEVQNFKISPNPSNDGFIKITYLLPQNADGVFEVFDLNGKIHFSQKLSPWSSLQNFNLSFLKGGIYQCVIKSGNSIASQKLIII